MSKMNPVRFNVNSQPEFFKEVKFKVDEYFKDNKISKYANTNMKLKTLFMLCLNFIPLVLILTHVVTSPLGVLSMWVLMGIGTSGIGLSVMHDANHGAYSSNKHVNNALGFLLNFIGAYHINWKIQHNVLHHSFTNIDGHDGDIANPVMRFSPTQKRKKFFRFQMYYAPFLYGIMTLYWMFFKDFKRLIDYNKKELLKQQGLSFSKALTETIFHKIWYLGLMLVLPIILVDLPWWHTVLGYLLLHFICGLLLSFVFQPAHVVEGTDFYEVDEDGSVENNWAIHQMRTTSNFANNGSVFSWFVGGLNYQIEHHLFPNICHVHYNKLSPIIKQTALKFNVPYHQHKTFLSAIKSHLSLLNQLGTGSYDTAKEM